MKTKVVLFISISAILSLLVFQAIILSDAYRLRKKNIETEVNTLFRASVEKEVLFRREESELFKDTRIISRNRESRDKDLDFPKGEEQELNDSEILEAGLFQQVLHFSNFPFKIHTLDSIIGNDLRNSKLSKNYTLIYCDSLGSIIEQTDQWTLKKMNKAYKTDALLIVDGKRVQAYVIISPPAVFKSLFGLLFASFFIVAFLSFGLIYQTNTIFTQKKLDALKTDFIHSFIHNIKSPLGTIKTILVKLLSNELDDIPTLKENFGKKGMSQIENLLIQSEKILTIARIEKGLSVVNRSKTDVHVMIEELRDKFTDSSNKQVSIQTSVSIDDDQSIYFDRSLICEALSNLIDNAIKYSGDSVAIFIDCHIIENTLLFRVLDNGYGISQKDQLHIYEKFERGAAVKRKEAKGFGLGLSFVKGVAEAHGGIVTLFSNEGEGSEFSISIPFRNVE